MTGQSLNINENNSSVTSSSAVTDDTAISTNLDSSLRDLLIGQLQAISDLSAKDVKELKDRQAEVERLHELLAYINAHVDEHVKKEKDKKGEIVIDEKLYDLLNKAIKNESNAPELNELKMKPDELKILQPGKTYSSKDREGLIANIRGHIDNLNTKNDMQLQSLTSLTNERFETYQLVRYISKVLEEMIKSCIRGASGR